MLHTVLQHPDPWYTEHCVRELVWVDPCIDIDQPQAAREVVFERE